MPTIAGLSSRQVASRTGLDASTVLKYARRKAFPGAKKVRLPNGRVEWRFSVASASLTRTKRSSRSQKPIATGAGADRYSQGMAHPFGKPTGKAVQLKRDQAILQLRINKASIPVAKVALKKFGLKMPTATRIVVES